MTKYVERGLAVLLAAALAIPLSAAEEKKPKPKLAPELETIYGMALAAPPEFAASALLRIAERVPEPPLRADFIAMAFTVAANSHHPFPLQALPGVEPDTAAASLANALKSGLDALSLQSRAVHMMLPIDAARAREMFTQMRRPAISRASCETSLLPDVSAYYTALGAVVQSGFTPAERGRSEHMSFVVGALSRIGLVREVAPAAAMLAGLNLPRNEYEIAMGALASRLENFDLDSRSYMASGNAIEEGIAAVIVRGKAMGSRTDSLAGAYRSFLVRELQAPRCPDSEMPAGRMVQGGFPQLFGEDIRGDLPPLSSEDTAPESVVEAEAAVTRYWQTEPAQRVFEECKKLRQAPDGTNYSEAARKSREWSRQFSDLLTSMAGWKASDESSEAAYVNQKATVYQALLELAPPGDAADRVVASFIEFMKNAALQQKSPVEWYWHARTTLDRVRADQPDRAAKLMAAYRNSGSIVLTLESMLDEVAPRNPF